MISIGGTQATLRFWFFVLLRRLLHKEDYKGFTLHYNAVVEAGLPTDLQYLRKLARLYNTPIPAEYTGRLPFEAEECRQKRLI